MKKYALRDKVPSKVERDFKIYSPLVRDLLFARGIKDTETAEKFLHPDYGRDVHDPFLLKNMDKVVDRIVSAIKKEEVIAIYSDYDADGIPGAVVLSDFFKKIEYKNIINYIPMRNEEGFGLNGEAVLILKKQNVKLLITIDCGMTDSDEVSLAKKKGIDVIITDHHLPNKDSKKIPKAFAIINPKQNGCQYPEKMLSGSGVIFKVVQALVQSAKTNFPSGQEKWMLDMVGLATLSDMVPLLGENRVFAYYGMKVFQKSQRIGLSKLFSLLKINQHNVTEDDIAFMITPRINAASRMGIPLDAFKLLSTTDEVEAGVLAEHLNNKNDERKGLVGSMVRDIKKRIAERDIGEMKNVLVLGSPEWKPSLLGLVANSFSDEHGRPVFLWGRNGESGDGVIKGSCRAGGETNIVHLMEKTKDIFIDYGGHKGAGGFSISHEHIHTLEIRLNESFLELQKEETLIPDILVDKKISLDEVSWEMYKSVEQFAPFGLDNPKPLFLLENVEVSAIKLFGKEKNHLELTLSDGNNLPHRQARNVTAMAFFSGPEKYSVPIEIGRKINLVATLEKSMFRGFPELRLRIVDIF